MTKNRPCEIVQIADFFGPKVSPCHSIPTDQKPSDRSTVRQLRLFMGRFRVGTLYRHRGYWHARVRDLESGRVFRMSSGERSRRRADEALAERLTAVLSRTERHRRFWDHTRSVVTLLSEVDSDEARARLAKLEAAIKCLEREGTAGDDETNAQIDKIALTVDSLLSSINERSGSGTAAKTQTGRRASDRGVSGGVPFAKAFQEFLETKDVRPRTLHDYEQSGHLFSRYFGSRTVDEITAKDVEDFFTDLKNRKRSQRTRKKHLNLLRSFFEKTVSWDYRSDNPTKGITIKIRDQKQRKALTLEQVQAMLDACRVRPQQKNHDIQHVWMAVFIGMKTGLRLSNVLGLRWSQVDLEEGIIHIPAKEYKTHRDFDLPINGELWRALRLWRVLRKDSPLVTDRTRVLGKRTKEIKVPFERIRKTAGLATDFHAATRHTFATMLVEAQVPHPVVKALMGHSLLRGDVTLRYTHPSMEKIREGVDRLPRLLRKRTSAEDPGTVLHDGLSGPSGNTHIDGEDESKEA